MKDTIDKAISLGFGAVIAGKEQIEKMVEELVEKGKVSRTESRALVDQLVKKGQESGQGIEALIRERISAMLDGGLLATRTDIERLERRLEALEQKAQPENG